MITATSTDTKIETKLNSLCSLATEILMHRKFAKLQCLVPSITTCDWYTVIIEVFVHEKIAHAACWQIRYVSVFDLHSENEKICATELRAKLSAAVVTKTVVIPSLSKWVIAGSQLLKWQNLLKQRPPYTNCFFFVFFCYCVFFVFFFFCLHKIWPSLWIWNCFLVSQWVGSGVVLEEFVGCFKLYTKLHWVFPGLVFRSSSSLCLLGRRKWSQGSLCRVARGEVEHWSAAISLRSRRKKVGPPSLYVNGAVCITSLYPKCNGSHFGLPPSSIHKMTGWVAISHILWRMRTAAIFSPLQPLTASFSEVGIAADSLTVSTCRATISAVQDVWQAGHKNLCPARMLCTCGTGAKAQYHAVLVLCCL